MNRAVPALFLFIPSGSYRMVARTETPNASLPWLVRITANCPNLLDAPKRRLPSTLHWGGQRVILATISTHSGGDGMVLHLADKTSANTTSPANSMLATSEYVACNGCAWKWRPRSVLQCIGVRMAASSWPTQSYTPKNMDTLYLARAFGAMYDLLLGKGALPCPSRNSRNSSTATI